MQFTVAFPMLPAEHLLPLATTAEAVGFTSAAVPESVFYPEEVSASYPYTADGRRFWGPDAPFVDPWVAIPAMAAVTRDLRFFTNVMKVSVRSPLLVAKTVSSAAAMSGGRVGLGVGLSWIPEEFAWLGQDMGTRGRRTDEAIEIIRAVTSGKWTEYHGRYHAFERLSVCPVGPGPVPIYVGGASEPALRRAARLGDGWISPPMGEAALSAAIRRIDSLRAEFARADEAFEVKVICSDVFDVDGFHRMESEGVTDAMVCPWYLYGGDPHDLAVQQAGLERFAAEVISPY